MKCHKIQDLIVTDYVDGQVSDKIRKDVERHLAECESCRKFEEDVNKEGIAPFEGVLRQKAPSAILAEVWKKIDSEEQRVSGFVEDSLRRWELRVFSRPSLALASMAAVFIIIFGANIWPGKSVSTVLINTSEQTEYFAYLTDYAAGVNSGEENNGYGTVIEKVFYN